MKKFIAAVVASAFAFGSVATFAADAAKKDELTVEQRTEMRDRAARMQAEGQRATPPAQEKVVKKTHKAKRSAVKAQKHAKKVSQRSVRKAHRQA